ncbi:MAG: KamA family radical SAM protein [Firmicutes bacterium]|nr:KamA family radical SAM protein [Bacillota bacterium]
MDTDVKENMDNKNNAQRRVKELEAAIQLYSMQKGQIPDGTTLWEKIKHKQEQLQTALKASPDDWQDWQWQVANRVSDVEQLAKLLQLSKEQEEEIDKVCRLFRFCISPYYLSLVNSADAACPIRRQAIPAIEEMLDQHGLVDPMAEEAGSPAPGVVQRYPDRIIINVTNRCAMFCRHCQRRRRIGQSDENLSLAGLLSALQYIKEHEQIRDVLITGGDALMLEDQTLDWLLTELEQIPHVEIKRIGTRVPVTLPMRITDDLCRMLGNHLPLYLNTQFNHPLEITPHAAEACLKLARSGIALGNQSVLLAGVNDNAFVIRKLNQMLLSIMVRPYYLFHAKPVTGTHHFRTPVETGIEIMRSLRGSTSGLAIPTFVVNAPGGLGKIALYPECLLGTTENKVLLQTWEGKIIEYDN